MSIAIAQPPGRRSCGLALGIGVQAPWTWAQACDRNGVPHLRRELSVLMAECQGSAEREAILAELDVRMDDARFGLLKPVRFEAGRRVGDVCQMRVAKDVLEIRFVNHTAEGRGGRHVRLYFTEPRDDAALVALKIASKHPGDTGLVEQTRHVREAARRASNWLRDQRASR